MPIVCSYLRKNCIFHSLTLTKLCDIRRGYLMNFYISLKTRNIAISVQQYDQSPQKFDVMMQNVSLKCNSR